MRKEHWRYLLPVLAAIALFSTLNGLWSLPSLALYESVPHSLAVYLGTSLPALALLWLAARWRLLTAEDAGFSLNGWRPGRRLLALAVILFMSVGAYHYLPPPAAPPADEAAPALTAAGGANQAAQIAALKPGWQDYGFWFAFLLSASLTELLVFCSLGFCLPEQWLRQRGVSPWVAAGLAAIFASVVFGVYHYTHPPRWWAFAIVPLIPVMLINLAVFCCTRNFHLTLLLHNGFAAVGFTGEQWGERLRKSPDVQLLPETYFNATYPAMAYIVGVFIVPYLLLHWLEAKAWRGTAD